MNGRRTTRLLTILAVASLLLLAAAPLVYADGTWTNQPRASPSARYGHAMASLGGDQVLLFGGYGGSLNGDTWVYDFSANTWTNKAPAPAPSARYSHAIAYLGGDQVLLFGGRDGSYYGDTWVYDLSDNTWTEQAPAAAAANGAPLPFGSGTHAALYDGPPARYGHAMAPLGGDQVLLFGGGGTSNLLGDTWVYDLSDNTWTRQALRAGPSPRVSSAMAYLCGDQVLLFGGELTSGRNGETWVYDLGANTWTDLTGATIP